MVAVAGRGWRLSPCLVRLMDETDALFPQRSTASDGSIGDLAHSVRASDHNPDDGWVDAVDITDDDAHGCDVGRLVDHLVTTRDKRISYLIHKGTIWKGYPNRGLPAFAPQPYTGSNAHKLHLHVSIVDTQRNNTSSWWPPKPKPQPEPAPEDDVAKIVKKTGRPEWWITDGITKRHITDRQEAAVLVFGGFAKWDNGKPYTNPALDLVVDYAATVS